MKFEKYSPSPEFPEVDAALRGAEGPVQGRHVARTCLLINTNCVVVGYHGYFGPCTRDFIKSCITAGLEHKHDVNTPKGLLGVTKVSWI